MEQGIYKSNIVCCTIGALGVILCGVYSLWIFNRIIFGNLKTIYTTQFNDINFREFSILLPLIFLVLFSLAYLVSLLL